MDEWGGVKDRTKLNSGKAKVIKETTGDGWEGEKEHKRIVGRQT